MSFVNFNENDSGLLSRNEREELEAMRARVYRPIMGAGVGVDDQPYGVIIRALIPPAAKNGYYPCRVQQDGGSDGGSASVASWTYTVRDYFSYQTLIVNAPQVKNRPFGKMTYGTGSQTVGVAFFGTATVELWDANEVPTVKVCGTVGTA